MNNRWFEISWFFGWCIFYWLWISTLLRGTFPSARRSVSKPKQSIRVFHPDRGIWSNNGTNTFNTNGNYWICFVFLIMAQQNGMTNLKSILIEQINSNGAMPLSNYIQQCLFHPIYGYYVKEPFLVLTAISQLLLKFHRCLANC